MDPYTSWDDIVPTQRSRPPQDDDFSQYFSEYKNFDNLFNEALTTLQDLDVPLGYPVATAPLALSSPFRHAKKPSGTAIFGFAEHTRDLSLNGHEIRLRPHSEAVRSISPSQLASRSAYPITNDQLDFNFSQPLEECKPIHLDEADELPKKSEDLIVTNSNPKSYKFPPDSLSPLRSPSHNFDDFLSNPLPTIRHPKQTQEYPEDIDILLADSKTKKYVPIPVQEPDMKYQIKSGPMNGMSSMNSTSMNNGPMNTSMNPNLSKMNSMNNMNSGMSTMTPVMTPAVVNPSAISPQMMMKHMSPNQLLPLRNVSSVNRDMRQIPAEPLNINMNVYLPPPSTSLSADSPEPHSPLPQAYSSPIRHNLATSASSQYEKRNFYNPQFFSDDAELYYEDQYQAPLLKSSPIRPYNDSFNNDTVTDANETILQLTPLKNQAPMTPLKKQITLEWSPIISPNEKANNDVRRAIQELSPKRIIKKTSLLPPGELDRYWEGPDENKVFTCTYKNCGKKFTRRYNVRSHIQTHLSDRPFTCTYCPKSFVRQHDLNRHIKSHMVSKHCKCKCGKEFTRVEGYRKHLTNGICSRTTESEGGVLKPGYNKHKGENILDGLTSNRLNDELGL